MNLRRVLTVLCVPLATAAAVPVVASAADSVTVRPDPTYRQEPFEGWGASLAWMAVATGGYPDQIRTKLADMVFGPEGLNFTIARFNIGGGNAPDVPPYLRPGGAVPGWWKAPAGTTRNDKDWWTPTDPAEFNPAADPNQRWWVDRIKNRVTKWETFSNSPPYFHTVSGYVSGGFNATDEQLRTEKIGDYTAYLAKATKTLERAHGITVSSVDPFNEPNTNYWKTTLGSNGNPTGGRQEGAHIGPAVQSQVIPEMRKALSAAGSQAVVSAPDETNPDLFAADWYGWSPESRAQVKQLNVHTYGTGNRPVARDIAKGAAKPLWMSEVGGSWLDRQDFTSMDPGLGLARQITDDLRLLEPRAWVSWQPIEDYNNMKPGGETPAGMNWGEIQVPFDCPRDATLATCPIRTNTKYHTMRNFTHYIKPGDRIIGVNDTASTVAMRGENLATVVHANATTADRDVVLDLSGFGNIRNGATVTPVITDVSRALQRGAPVRVINKKATIRVPARSVTSFVVNGVSSAAPGTGIGSGKPFSFTGVQSGKSLNAENGSVVQRTTDASAPTQRWVLTNRTGCHGNRDQYTITNAGTKQVLSTADGAVTLAAPGTDNAASRWILSSTGDTTWTFVNVGTGQLLDVVGESREDGARIGLYRPTNGANQRWTAAAQ
ncbi:ricin-type beta-trefoil lectin domain protein [Kibdelosporangium aridum]|uniref:Ricin-type beta-trefoil lectin domain protein n=1 Tax=Kibdelosporangium aridum TaxID=2030 RepID=A0A428ZKR9_KIBAR|nr:RICIN domain-containing protein [Kibdelosporangium aridum]RSM88687.1 ricin-type beta-trefoil lectin domain protein [Kibdelosporangium aridum]